MDGSTASFGSALTEQLREADPNGVLARPGQKPGCIDVNNNSEGCHKRQTASSVTSIRNCTICLDDIDLKSTDVQPTWLKCMHVFHTSCINPWLKGSNNCPLCRTEIDTRPGEVAHHYSSSSSSSSVAGESLDDRRIRFMNNVAEVIRRLDPERVLVSWREDGGCSLDIESFAEGSPERERAEQIFLELGVISRAEFDDI